jgi:hypothetical protein
MLLSDGSSCASASGRSHHLMIPFRRLLRGQMPQLMQHTLPRHVTNNSRREQRLCWQVRSHWGVAGALLLLLLLGLVAGWQYLQDVCGEQQSLISLRKPWIHPTAGCRPLVRVENETVQAGSTL